MRAGDMVGDLLGRFRLSGKGGPRQPHSHERGNCQSDRHHG